MRIVSWNVNSIRARENRVLNWLERHRPEVGCLQEIKCVEEDFPFEGFEQLGYYLTIRGQKSYNGVATATLAAPQDVALGTPWAEDNQARGLALRVDGVRVVNLYVPNGSEVGSEKYAYKLAWLDRLRGWLGSEASAKEALVLCGDFNIAPEDRDVYDVEALRGAVLCSDSERERLEALIGWGLVDAFRHFYEEAGRYTWWDDRGAMFQRGLGLRIDHHLVTESILARAADVEVDEEERSGEKPSDHAPVTLVLRDE